MRPIDVTVDSSLCQALTCADLRFPRSQHLSKFAAELSICLRFAVIGIGAAHHILNSVPRSEQLELVPELRFFGTMIREHLEQERLSNRTTRISFDCPNRAQAIYCYLFDRYVTLSRISGPLDLILSILVEEFVQEHSVRFANKFLFFRNRAQDRAFDTEAQKSLRFALNFLERRNYDLEEVPEIALIGE